MRFILGFGFFAVVLVVATGLADGGRAKPQAAGGPLATLAFLAGTWRGEMDGEFVEEIWSEPAPGKGETMMGMFRWLNAEGRPRMYEMLTLSHEEGETLLRLRHHTSKMVAWEEKETPVTLRLVEATHEPQRAVFETVAVDGRLARIVFARKKDSLAIDVEFREGMGETLAFRFEQVARLSEP